MRIHHLLFTVSVIAFAQQRGDTFTTIPEPLSSADRPASDWRMVLDADLILKVRIDYPGAPDPGNPGYRKVDWKVIDTLKGNPPNPVSPQGLSIVRVIYYESDGAGGVSPDSLKRLSGEVALVFLTWSDGGPGTGAYLCQSHEAVQRYDPAVAIAVKSEIQNQNEMAASVQRVLDTRAQPLESDVLALIQSLRDSGAYERHEPVVGPDKAPEGAFTFPRPIDGLERLGPAAIPAIIKHLDDRRPLPLGKTPIELDIRNEPSAFEGIYHTSASEMVDVLRHPLEKLAHASFGDGSCSDRSRAKVILGWRLYLGHNLAFRHALGMAEEPK